MGGAGGATGQPRAPTCCWGRSVDGGEPGSGRVGRVVTWLETGKHHRQSSLPGEDAFSALGWGCVRTPLFFSFGFWGSCYLGRTLGALKSDNGAWMALTVSGGRGWGRGRRTDGRAGRLLTLQPQCLLICADVRGKYTPLGLAREFTINKQINQTERARPEHVVVAQSPLPVWRDVVS